MTELDAAHSAHYALESFAGAVHATGVAIDGHAVLIAGKSGSGKSDLALRLIDRGAILLSDDYTHVERKIGAVLGSAPANIAGQMEVYGIGILSMPHALPSPVRLIVHPGEGSPEERCPLDTRTVTLCGVPIPVLSLRFPDASAPIKVELALRHLLAPLSERMTL